jgi:hypothetical protein
MMGRKKQVLFNTLSFACESTSALAAIGDVGTFSSCDVGQRVAQDAGCCQQAPAPAPAPVKGVPAAPVPVPVKGVPATPVSAPVKGMMMKLRYAN